MKVFLDANVLIAVLNREYPLYSHAAQVLSLADNKRVTHYVSPLSIAIAFYFASKKSGQKQAKCKIALLMEHVKTAPLDHASVTEPLGAPIIEDLEDGMQYHAALKAGCEVIVTEDLNDFYFSEIPVMDAEGFLAHYRNS